MWDCCVIKVWNEKENSKVKLTNLWYLIKHMNFPHGRLICLLHSYHLFPFLFVATYITPQTNQYRNLKCPSICNGLSSGCLWKINFRDLLISHCNDTPITQIPVMLYLKNSQALFCYSSSPACLQSRMQLAWLFALHT